MTQHTRIDLLKWLPFSICIASAALILNVRGNVDCYTVKSEKSSTSDDAITSIGCGNNTLVSCGGSTFDTSDDDFDGTYFAVKSKECVAVNAIRGAGVYAHARCCKFNNDIEVIYSESDVYSQKGMCLFLCNPYDQPKLQCTNHIIRT